jgi:hypothetical protein
MKAAIVCILSVFLGTAVPFPAVALADPTYTQGLPHTDSMKNYLKHQKKEQKKARRLQRRAEKNWKKAHNPER